MYSNEDRMKVIRLYIEYDYNARAVIRELGYPSRNRLAIWYKEYQKQRNTRGRFGICEKVEKYRRNNAARKKFSANMVTGSIMRMESIFLIKLSKKITLSGII
jgi:transposase-like protein